MVGKLVLGVHGLRVLLVDVDAVVGSHGEYSVVGDGWKTLVDR